MKLKELLENIEELSKLVSGELKVEVESDCKLDTEIALASKSSPQRLNIVIIYPMKRRSFDRNDKKSL